jgi:signal transduction histidine kinase
METVRLNARDEVEWIIGTNLDITEQRRTEEELAAQKRLLEQRVLERTAELERTQANLRRSERIGAMGTLAAGMGHDLTNIMVPIRWRLDALEKQDMPPGVRADVADIADSMGYLERLAAGLRQMAANPDAAPPPGGTDLTEWWAEASGLLRSVLARKIRLVSDIPDRGAVPALSRVHINRIGLTQAVFNLVQNANEILVPRGEGIITISARPSAEDGGASVMLSVSDTGPGMAPEVAARCFEPYFSTKGRAVSTGMGLSLVRGIVENVGGTVILRTTPGEGATFLLRLPVASRPNAVPTTTEQSASSPDGNGTEAVGHF